MSTKKQLIPKERERGIVAEWLIEKYDASAADFMYKQFARNAKQVLAWQEDIDRGLIPAEFAEAGMKPAEVGMMVEAQALNVLKQAKDLVPFELAAKKAVEHSGMVELADRSAVDAPSASKDWEEWQKRHGVGTSTRTATTRH